MRKGYISEDDASWVSKIAQTSSRLNIADLLFADRDRFSKMIEKSGAVLLLHEYGFLSSTSGGDKPSTILKGIHISKWAIYLMREGFSINSDKNPKILQRFMRKIKNQVHQIIYDSMTERFRHLSSESLIRLLGCYSEKKNDIILKILDERGVKKVFKPRKTKNIDIKKNRKKKKKKINEFQRQIIKHEKNFYEDGYELTSKDLVKYVLDRDIKNISELQLNNRFIAVTLSNPTTLVKLKVDFFNELIEREKWNARSVIKSSSVVKIDVPIKVFADILLQIARSKILKKCPHLKALNRSIADHLMLRCSSWPVKAYIDLNLKYPHSGSYIELVEPEKMATFLGTFMIKEGSSEHELLKKFINDKVGEKC